MDVDIQVSDETKPGYSVADNFAENLIDAIRSDMVANESQYLLINLGYASGLFENPSNYISMKVEGSSGDGKSELKGNVDARWPNHWLFKTTQTSDKGLIDSPRWNQRYVAALDEMNKLPANTLEFLKSSDGDDADEDGYGFTYTRNVDEGDDGRGENVIKKQSMPFIFLFADENSMSMDWELATRVMEIKVESDADTNEAVGAAMFDHEKVEVESKDHDYIYNFEEGKNAIDNHIANIPRPNLATMEVGDDTITRKYARPVVIPYDDEKFGWDAWRVVKPIFDFKQADSKRAANTVANLIRSSALLNYHNREIIEIGNKEHYLAEPQDVANVLACRKTLLGMTHDLDEKKFAVIEALTDEHNGVGGTGPSGGLAAPLQDIHEYIEDYANVSSLSESHLRTMLRSMADRFILNEWENEGENGAHLYEFHGGSTFGHPNLDEYPNLFDGVTDPIRDQPIHETVEQMKDELNAVSSDDLLDTDSGSLMGGSTDSSDTSTTDDTGDDSEGDLSSFGAGTDDTDAIELSEVEAAVHEQLRETIDDYRITTDDGTEPTAGIRVAHMVGASPVEYYNDDESSLRYVRAERPYQDGDKAGTILDPNTPLWGDVSEGQVQSQVEAAIASLREKEVFEIHDEDEDGEKYMVVHETD